MMKRPARLKTGSGARAPAAALAGAPQTIPPVLFMTRPPARPRAEVGVQVLMAGAGVKPRAVLVRTTVILAPTAPR